MAVDYLVTETMLKQAREIAEARLHDSSRRLSPDRPTARNLQSQIRGALGEIVAREWLSRYVLHIESGFLEDHVSQTDLSIGNLGVEVMTAKVNDRKQTGFCVPPNKLAAARSRRAWGYLFVGSDNLVPPQMMTIQFAVRLEDVDSAPARHTYVNNPSFRVLNFVVEEDRLMTPEEFLRIVTK